MFLISLIRQCKILQVKLLKNEDATLPHPTPWFSKKTKKNTTSECLN